MNPEEQAKRIAAWGWAAVTLGVETSPDRIMGLVEVTESVPLARLKPALEAVIKSEPAGFLPSPGAVIEAAKRHTEREYADQPRALSAGREMSKEDHRRWMAKNNPEGWDDRTWRAFTERIATDPMFERRVWEAFKNRQDWSEEQARAEIRGRRVDTGFRLRLRRRLNLEAFDVYPRPNPLEDGWLPAAEFDPIAGLAKRMMA